MSAPLVLLLVLSAASLIGCATESSSAAEIPDGTDLDRETARVLDVLNAETRAALGRDYSAWRAHWVHAPYVVKTYTDEADGSASVMLGWDAVDDFVRTYLEEHPEPEAPPPPLTAADVQVFGDTAWVVYEQDTAGGGRKREARRMERAGGAWRIAGMHTTIVGAK